MNFNRNEVKHRVDYFATNRQIQASKPDFSWEYPAMLAKKAINYGPGDRVSGTRPEALGRVRESINVYNLARKSVFPSFIIACVVYISHPFSINPTLVILPFALMMGVSTRNMFERLKKYF